MTFHSTRLSAVALCVLSMAARLAAQVIPPARDNGLEAAVTYRAVQARHSADGSSFFLQGGAIDLRSHFYRGFGVFAEVTGEHAEPGSTGGAPFSQVVTVFGPRYTQRVRARTSVFGHVLFGEANAFDTTLRAGPGPTTNTGNSPLRSASSSALVVGGGIDAYIRPHLSARLLQADWLRTQLPNGATNVQNNLRLGIGLVFVIHR